MSRVSRDSAYFERREARRVDDARVETRVDARVETRTRASDANFPSTRGILWDASAAGEATTASSGTSAPTTVRLDGDATRALARAIADASTARDGVSAAKGTRGKVARTRGNDEAGRAALIGDNRDSSETVRVSVTTEDDCEHYSSALEDGCVEIAMETLPRDFSGGRAFGGVRAARDGVGARGDAAGGVLRRVRERRASVSGDVLPDARGGDFGGRFARRRGGRRRRGAARGVRHQRAVL